MLCCVNQQGDELDLRRVAVSGKKKRIKEIKGNGI
jgi:hypothetical protein